MASSVGCWTSSSKVGRSGFFSFFSSYHVRRCFWTHTLIPSPLVGILDCTFARVLYSTALFIRLYIPMLFYVFLWVFWVSSSGASTSGNAPFARRFTTFFINSFKLCSYPGQSTSPFAYVASLLLFNYRRHCCNFRSSMCSRSRRA